MADEPKDEQYRTPWVGIVAGIMLLRLLPDGWWSVLVAIGIGRAAQYVYNFMEEWRRVNSSTGFSPKSSSILFWRRPRPRQE